MVGKYYLVKKTGGSETAVIGGEIGKAISINSQCADLYLRANQGRGLKLFAILIQMLVRQRRLSERRYKKDLEERKHTSKSLQEYSGGFANGVARYNFFPAPGTRINGGDAVKKYYDDGGADGRVLCIVDGQNLGASMEER